MAIEDRIEAAATCFVKAMNLTSGIKGIMIATTGIAAEVMDVSVEAITLEVDVMTSEL